MPQYQLMQGRVLNLGILSSNAKQTLINRSELLTKQNTESLAT